MEELPGKKAGTYIYIYIYLMDTFIIKINEMKIYIAAAKDVTLNVKEGFNKKVKRIF